MSVAGAIRSSGIPAVGSSTDRSVPLFSGTLGDALQAQANLLVSSGGAVLVRQSGGVAGTDEGQLSHTGSLLLFESKDGSIDLLASALGITDYCLRVRTDGRVLPKYGFISSQNEYALSDTIAIWEFMSTLHLKWSSTTSYGGAKDLGIKRAAAGVLCVTDGSTGGGAVNLPEKTAPATPAASSLSLYAEDTGGGKTRLVIKWVMMAR